MRWIILALSIALAGCNVAGTGFVAKTPVTSADLYKARAAYDAAVLAPAARYASLPRCTVHPQPCSSYAVVLKLRQVDGVASTSLNAAADFVRLHPTLDASAFIAAATRAVTLARHVAIINGVK